MKFRMKFGRLQSTDSRHHGTETDVDYEDVCCPFMMGTGHTPAGKDTSACGNWCPLIEINNAQSRCYLHCGNNSADYALESVS